MNTLATDYDAQLQALGPEIDRFIALVATTPMDAPVPSCPGWTVADLARHLGRVHRWAAGLVANLAPARMKWQELGITIPEDDNELVPWLIDGGALLRDTLAAADPTVEMWAWGFDQHVAFWGRRQLHETALHRIDVELAAGVSSPLDAAVATDCVAELLENLAPGLEIDIAPMSMRLSATDTKVAWLAQFGPGLASDYCELDALADVALSGPSDLLIRAVTRRAPLNSAGIEPHGEPEVISSLLSHLDL